MKRRDFVSFAGAAALTSALPRRARAARAADVPLNLLFLWTDQQRPDTMGCYGNAQARTPNLDALAAQSAVFENARVVHPVCTPSRGTLLTGRWPHETGVTANNIPLPATTPCVPELLARRDDYATGYMGKWHLGDEVFAQHGFRTWVSIEDNYEKYFSAQRDRSTRSDYHHYLVAQGFKPDRPNNTFKRTTACALPAEHTKPEFLARHATEFLRQHGRQPFVLSVNFLEPHSPYLSILRDRYDPAQCPRPETFDQEFGAEMPVRYRFRQANDRSTLRDLAALQEVNAHYWGLTEQVDRSVGRILRALEASGAAERTIVVFTSDHGDQMGAHRMLGKGVMYEESARIPLFIRAPGLRPARIAHPVSHIDFVPTLLDLLRSPAPGNFHGKSWRPLLEGRATAVEPVFMQWSPNPTEGDGDDPARLPPGFSAEDAARARSVSARTIVAPDGLKLTLRHGDVPTLFDLRRDPHESKNLVDEPAYRDRRRELTGRIAAWQQRTGDRLAVT